MQRPCSESPADLDLLVLALAGPFVLVELSVVEAVVAEAVVLDHERRPIPVRIVQRDPNRRLERDGWVVGGPADVVGADLATQRNVGGPVWRTDRADVGDRQARGKAALLCPQEEEEATDGGSEDQHQERPGKLLSPALHAGSNGRPLKKVRQAMPEQLDAAGVLVGGDQLAHPRLGDGNVRINGVASQLHRLADDYSA